MNRRSAHALKPTDKQKQDLSLMERARQVLKVESEAIADLIDRIETSFAEVVHALDRCEGHIVVTGIGKSGLIGAKIAATFSSIGLPAVFLHAAEASHGDVGVLAPGDLVLAISNSGETEEIVRLLPRLNRTRCLLVGLIGNPDSTLARRCDFVLNTSVKAEACSMGLVPTASTTAALAMGDALAMALLDLRGLREEDFALNHPGGSLGRKLLMTVADLMHRGNAIPKVAENANVFDVLKEMSGKRLGTTCVVDAGGHLKGVITDGDLRRLIERKKDISQATACDLMGADPKCIGKEALAAKAVEVMQTHSITALVVSEDRKTIDGIIHLHDLLKAGIV